MTSTYDLIASNVLTTTATQVDFTGIGGYRDLIVVSNFVASATTVNQAVRINNNNNNIYSTIYTGSSSSTAFNAYSSGDNRTLDGGDATTTERQLYIWQFFDASATDKQKTMLLRSGRPGTGFVNFATARVNTTSAITSIQLLAPSGTYAIGSTFDIYGIVS